MAAVTPAVSSHGLLVDSSCLQIDAPQRWSGTAEGYRASCAHVVEVQIKQCCKTSVLALQLGVMTINCKCGSALLHRRLFGGQFGGVTRRSVGKQAELVSPSTSR